MCSLSRSFRLCSTLMIEEEAMVITKNQGIGSILESNISDETSNKSSSSSSSLRRTLSADMSSSTKWLTQNWLSPMKKIASSEEFSICSITDSSSSEEEDDDDDDDETEPRGQFDIWSSIIQQKSQVITDLPPPYIHPLVKRSAASSLTQKSLQICTESLGSETGSDGLISSYPSSDSGDVTDDDKYMQQERSVEQSFDHFKEQGSVPKYNYVKKSLQRRPFPPPMPSRRMHSCRDNGRLILESVSFPSENNNFIAQRRDGRLVLTFASSIEQEEEEEEEKEVAEFEEGFGCFDDEGKESDEAEEEEEAAFVMELQAPKVSSRVINLHRLTLMGVANRDTTLSTWPNKFNEVVQFDEVEEDIKPAIVAKSLPPMAQLIPKSAAAGTGTAALAGGGGGGGGASLNAYEYYWRPKHMATTQSKSNKKNTQEEQQQLILLRGNKGENLVPLVKSCKEPRRSLLFWEPYCIATS